MPVDTSMYGNIQTPQIQSPLDTAVKAMTMKHLLNQTKVEDQQLGDQQAVRDAFKSAATIGPDGKPTVDRGVVLSSLYKSNPMQAMQQEAGFKKMDLDAIEQKRKELSDQATMGKELVYKVASDEKTPLIQKQAQWSQMLADSTTAKLPNVDKLPAQYPGDDFVNRMKYHMLTATEQLAQQNKQTEQGFEERKVKTGEGELGVKKAELGVRKDELVAKREDEKKTKYASELQQTQQLIESGKGASDVQQALRDQYSAKKVTSLIDSFGKDPNKMNMSMVRLTAAEVAKMAQGGAPTMEEMKGLTPGAFPGILAEAAERFNNKPTAANAGAFITQFRRYSDAIGKDANEVLENKLGRIVEVRKPYLHPDDYASLKKNYKEGYVNKSFGDVPSNPADLHKMDDDKVDALFKHFKDLDASRISSQSRKGGGS